ERLGARRRQRQPRPAVAADVEIEGAVVGLALVVQILVGAVQACAAAIQASPLVTRRVDGYRLAVQSCSTSTANIEKGLSGGPQSMQCSSRTQRRQQPGRRCRKRLATYKRRWDE